MKSILIKEPNRLEICDKSIPVANDDEVLVKIKLAGICGSDSHIYRGHNPFAMYPRVIGHEFFGVIEAVGKNINPIRIGERVSVDPVLSCGHCYPCSIGRPNVCATLKVFGVHADGGFTEYVAVPASNAHNIPNTISDDFAVTVEPYSIAANVTAHINPTEDDIALIYGAGTMGITCVQVLKGVYNVNKVIVVDRLDERLERAKKSGADICVNNSEASLSEYMRNSNLQPTLIIDAACHPTILQEAISIASPAARISIMGFSSQFSEITQQSITSKEIAIFSSRLNANRFPDVISWMEKKLIDPSFILTHKFPFIEAQKAIEIFENDVKSCCKILLEF